MKKTKKAKPKTKKIIRPRLADKKPATKTVQKKGALTTKKVKVMVNKSQNAVLKSQTPIHDADYWLNRPNDDKHLDWGYSLDWIDGYWLSWRHPHRDLILEALKEFEPFDLLELGCNVGPNLNLVRKEYGGIRLVGIDIDARVIEIARDRLRDVEFQVGNITKIPYDTQSFSVILADASLMYLNKNEIKLALDEIQRVARKGVIIVDRFDESLEGIRSGDVWARNYTKLLEGREFKVRTIKITKKLWPNSVGWAERGMVWVATKSE